MFNLLTKFKSFRSTRAPYLGDEKAPRPYRDWYVLVVFSFVVLICMIVGYGYITIRLSTRQPLAENVLIEQSLSKIKPGEIDRVAAKILAQETMFLGLLASSTSSTTSTTSLIR